MFQKDKIGGGTAESTAYTTYEVKECPQCGRLVYEGYECREITRDEANKIADGAVEKEKRTESQNNALQVWCGLIAEAYNERGLDVPTVLNNFTMDVYWTKDLVRKLIVNHANEKMFGKKSTKELLKQGEIDKIVDVVTKFNAKMGVEYIEFPSRSN